MCVDAAPCKKKTMAEFDYIKLTSSVSSLKTLFWIDSKLHDMKFYLRMIDHTCNTPREWKQSGALSDWPKVPILNDLLLLTVLCLSWQAESEV
jgi:hypothetical protein